MDKTRKIRISERGEGVYNLVVVNDRRVSEQGRAEGNTPEAAYAYALRTLPADVLDGATWEFRSVDGVYATLDPVKLGWA